MRGSRNGEQAVHLVSAYAAKARLVLAQQAVADKSNEIGALPDLLSMLELKGEAEADYVLALKDNQPTLCEDVSLWLDTEAAKGALPVYETVEKDHGRIEIRRYVLSAQIDWLEQKSEWKGLTAVGRVESIRQLGEHTTTEHRSPVLVCRLDALCRGSAQSLGNRKRPTLGVGCAVWRRCPSRAQEPFTA